MVMNVFYRISYSQLIEILFLYAREGWSIAKRPQWRTEVHLHYTVFNFWSILNSKNDTAIYYFHILLFGQFDKLKPP